MKRVQNALTEKQRKEIQHIMIGGLISLAGLATTIAAQLIVALNGRDIPRAPEIRQRPKDKRSRLPGGKPRRPVANSKRRGASARLTTPAKPA
jgi:hypothetical protein